ncbi:MAG: precorrin-6y C5,15-methyltransferase (decarboxylating) subunit CbiE [Clostridium sp.]|nr:precorrin-6y C5,15-methyltransferase (decarboxylating) subunit CbiE [Clostridium sp.]
MCNMEIRRTVNLISLGVGSFNTLTFEANDILKKSDVIICVGKAFKTLEKFNKPIFVFYKSLEILKFIEDNQKYENIAIAYLGDVGFYSNANNILKRLSGYDVKVIPGVSSMAYFASKLKIPWEDMEFISFNGKETNIVAEVLNNEKVFTLLGAENCDLNNICNKLVDYGLQDINMAVGCNLSFDNECIKVGKVKEFVDYTYNGLCVCIFFNENCNKRIYNNIQNENLLYNEGAKINEEARSLSIIKLGLTQNSVVYDIGAKTGSVSVEAALNIPKGKVYAIEKDDENINIINENKKKFKADNLYIVKGKEPEILMNLDIPTHAFIDGISNNLEEIIEVLLYKNPKIRIVINAITSQSLMKILECIEKFPLVNVDITHLSVVKGKNIKKSNLLKEENNIYIITLEGTE